MIWYAYWHCLVRGRVKVSKFDSICEDEDKSTQDSFLVDAVIAICVTAVFYDPTTLTTKALGNISLEGETNIRLYLWLLLVPFNSFTLYTTFLPITRCDKGWCKKITLKPIFQDNNSIQENIWYFLSRDKKRKKEKKKEVVHHLHISTATQIW